MANCHFHQIQSPVPVGVITDLDNNIIIANVVENDKLDVPQAGHAEWLLSGARVMITRFWASSTCSFVIVPYMPSSEDTIPLLPEGIGLEKEFCLWLGYIDKVRRVTSEDLTNGNLVRTFVGIIENLPSTASSRGGITIQVQARDRMKWFMDSEVYYSTQEITEIGNDTGEKKDKTLWFFGGKSVVAIPRTSLVFDIMRRAIGAPRSGAVGEDGWSNKRGIFYDNASEDITFDDVIEPFKFYKFNNLSGKVTTPNKVNAVPKFRGVSTRIAITNDSDATGLTFLMTGQLPLDIVKSVAFQEVYPTEFFQDSRDGNFYYVPRGNDSSGLADVDRFYRTYFFNTKTIYDPETEDEDKLTPEGAKKIISANQQLIAFREEISTIGLKTNFFVSRSSPMATLEPHKDYVIHLETNPYILRGVNYAPKFHRINDPTIQNVAEAATVAMGAARIWGKETNAAMAVMLGDPSLVPGEVLQIFGSPLLEGGGIDRAANDFKNYTEWDANTKQMIIDFARFGKDESYSEVANREVGNEAGNKGKYVIKHVKGEYEMTFYDGSKVGIKGVGEELKDNDNTGLAVEGFLTKGKSVHQGKDEQQGVFSEEVRSQGGFEEVPRTMYRIEAVHHKFNLGSPGFTTEIALTTPF